jgi:hypothetical protein
MKLLYECPKCGGKVTMFISPSVPPTCSHKGTGSGHAPALMLLDGSSDGVPSYEEKAKKSRKSK